MLAAFLAVGALEQVVQVSQIVEFVIALIGLGIAIDYSLLVVTRWREESAGGADPHEAVVRAMEHAGRAVVFSGITVAIGLLSLVVIPVPFLRSVGYGGVLVPLATVAAAVTLLPVVLATVGPLWIGRGTGRLGHSRAAGSGPRGDDSRTDAAGSRPLSAASCSPRSRCPPSGSPSASPAPRPRQRPDPHMTPSPCSSTAASRAASSPRSRSSPGTRRTRSRSSCAQSTGYGPRSCRRRQTPLPSRVPWSSPSCRTPRAPSRPDRTRSALSRTPSPAARTSSASAAPAPPSWTSCTPSTGSSRSCWP